MYLPSVTLIAALLTLVRSAPTCTNITISVTTQPTKVIVPALSLGGLISLLGELNAFASSTVDALIGGTFNIAATYCEPEVEIASRANTLQILIHGATYSKDYWVGLYQGDQYSWVNSASLNGYPTLAIDRLGNGQSDHPDPTLDVQVPLQAACVHEIIGKARAGTGPFTRSYNKIIIAGHSYGSYVTNTVNTLWPEDADASILTGWSAYFLSAFLAVLVKALPLPAALLDPRYTSLPLLYLEISQRAGFNGGFYSVAGTFNQSMQDMDYETRGTFSLGEGATGLFPTSTAHGFTGPVYVMTGDQDAIFCNLVGFDMNATTGLAQHSGNCSSNTVLNYLQTSSVLYPDSKDFGYYIVPDSGHCWQLHYAAQSAFNNAHQWLTEQGF